MSLPRYSDQCQQELYKVNITHPESCGEAGPDTQWIARLFLVVTIRALDPIRTVRIIAAMRAAYHNSQSPF